MATFGDILKNAGTGFELHDPGPYDVQVFKATVGNTTGQSKKPKISTRLRILTGPKAGKEIYNDFTLTLDNPNAMFFFTKHMAMLGADAKFMGSIADLDTAAALAAVAEKITGAYATIHLDHREWPPNSGDMRNNVSKIEPYTGPQIGMSSASSHVAPATAGGMPPF